MIMGWLVDDWLWLLILMVINGLDSGNIAGWLWFTTGDGGFVVCWSLLLVGCWLVEALVTFKLTDCSDAAAVPVFGGPTLSCWPPSTSSVRTTGRLLMLGELVGAT